MKSNDQWQKDDNFIDLKLEEAFGYEDEQLAEELDDFVNIVNAAKQAGEAVPKGPEGECQRILDRMERESTGGIHRRKRGRMRKAVKLVVAAAVVGTLVLSGGMWAGAKRVREYQTNGRADMDNVVVFDNNPDNLIGKEISDLEKAYLEIGEKLDIQVLELSYLPEEIEFYRSTISRKRGVIEFVDGKNRLFFYQGLNDKANSLSYVTDMEEYKQVYNSFLDEQLPVYQKTLENGDIEFSIWIVYGNQYCILQGNIPEGKFIQIADGIRGVQ